MIIKPEILSGLHPIVVEATVKTIEALNNRGIVCNVHSGTRTFKRQQELYALGRSIKNPDWYHKDDKPMGNIVTNARPGDSFHNYGLAIDVVRMTPQGNWTWGQSFSEIGEVGKQHGFEWGGDWVGKDLPHLQMRFGYTITELKNLVASIGMIGIWNRITKNGGTK